MIVAMVAARKVARLLDVGEHFDVLHLWLTRELLHHAWGGPRV